MVTAHPWQKAANAIRFLSVDAIVHAGEGHQGVPLGMAEIATALYFGHLKHDPMHPTWWDRDRVVLSNGHGSMLLYSLLYLSGYEHLSIDQIRTFRELGSRCAGHPEYDPHSGIELTTGQLGQGIANALGMAVAEAFLRRRFSSNLVNHYTYAFVGDGCLQEGVGQEMVSLAGHLRMSRLILLMDDNEITDDGSTALSISESVAQRFEVAHWHVEQVDGHQIAEVAAAISRAKKDERPSIILAKTVIAKGIERLQGQRGGHSAKLYPQDADAMRKTLHWPHAPFEIPADTLLSWRESAKPGQVQHKAWRLRLEKLESQERAEFERAMTGKLPDKLTDLMKQLKKDLHQQPARGGINLSAAINDALTAVMPNRIVACADLEAPTDHKRQLQAFSALSPEGNYIHCGVREHVMGSMVTGLAAHGGVVPVSVTYLAFSDYMRPAIRMSALMRLPVIFIFSHDSIGIGKNGPTHQPVEILASLRAMPHLLVMRPADAVEAVECWESALENKGGPVCLVFARQVLPNVRQKATPDNLSSRGAYVLAAESQAPRQVTLLATGSEVDIALSAKLELEKQGISTAVVSMPCWALFEKQDASYRETVLCPGTCTVGIEAAVKFGWERYLGDYGLFIGMSDFGLSGPPNELYEHFGITCEAVVRAAHASLRSKA